MQDNNENNVNVENVVVQSQNVGEVSVGEQNQAMNTNNVDNGSVNGKKNNKKIIIVIAIIILVMVIGVVAFLIFYKDADKEKDANLDNKVSDVDDSNENGEDLVSNDNSLKLGNDFKISKSGSDYKEYTLDYGKYVNKGEVFAILDNEATISINISDVENSSEYLNFEFYINNKLVYKEEELFSVYDTTFYFYTLGTYIIFNKNLSATDSRSDCIVVYDKSGDCLKEITDIDIDNLEGMYTEDYEVSDGQLIIKATRYYHGPVVFIGGEQYNFCGSDEAEEDIFSASLSESISVEVEYYYSLRDGNLDLNNPEVKVKKTLKNLREEDAECVASLEED